MRFFQNDTGNPNAYYEPNSVNGPVQDAAVAEPPLKISADADRYDHRQGNDDYTQAGDLFRLMSLDQQDRLMDNIAVTMAGVPMDIVRQQIGHFSKADPAYGKGVADRMKIELV